jgi:RNA polymerase sigma-70 factor (ECF subfamily)
LEDCYERHRNEVYRLCLRYGGGRCGWAEDVTHDVFIKLIERLPELEDPSALGGWLYRVTSNLCISRLRRDRSVLTKIRTWISGQRDEAAPVDAVFERKEAARAALAALEELPARQRIVVCMKLLDGKPQKEIAELLAMSESYVSKLLARAYARLNAAGWELNDA